ncbi:MAG: hypothetical protein US86_C0002G0018 [Candidatus Daviesbacteria bacterium GW2011_GWA2_38_24]|uniref:DUF11 domain-containing protein n=1 Tax=Candidatus Daviesbacteria bacterium GW2011_GWA2_38_24 TaxID=1618422 RepID=A0A0G0MPP6_9BACT|nr:MAG: hypothetical protein US86_C0002G0018 [Candidatus Daviesbacteria bacterium GW2011_GWA2_38_24]OGE23587.1 MAG: hypothetical protein A2688_03515 [Candidatus Daviesbacteria bacterium RIFCSPHIGHO2_01_FULL_38_8]
MIADNAQFFRSFFQSVFEIKNNKRPYFNLFIESRYVPYSQENAIKLFWKRINTLDKTTRDPLFQILSGAKTDQELIDFLHKSYRENNKYLVNLTTETPVPETQPQIPQSPNIITPISKEVTHKIGLGIQLLNRKIPTVLKASAVAGLIGGAAGLATTGSLAGAAVWGAGAAAAPLAIHYGLGNQLLGLGSKAASSLNNFVERAHGNDPDADAFPEDEEGEASAPPQSTSRGGIFKSLINPKNRIWLFIFIFLIILLVIVLLSSGGIPGQEQSPEALSTKNLEITKSGPNKVNNNEPITYKITIKYKGLGTADIKVTDQLSTKVKFQDTESKPSGKDPCETNVQGSVVGTADSGQVVTWNLNNMIQDTTTLCLTVLPVEDDVYNVNTARAEITDVKTSASAELSITAAAPENIPDKEAEINYPITVTYKGSGTATIEVTSPIPDKTVYLGSSAKEGCEAIKEADEAGENIKWSSIELKQGESTGLCLTLKATADNIKITHPGIGAKITKVELPLAEETDAPSTNDCSSKYTTEILKNPLNINYGDPVCSFTKDDLYKLLKQQDPQNADFWFVKVIPCESTYSPNAYNPGAVDTTGAWGLFQMGRGKNGVYDHGDVVWQQQISNAITYNNNVLAPIGRKWQYWHCAR